MFSIFSHFISFYLGNVYVADQSNQLVRKVTISTGIITTIAGTGTTSYSGDNGEATAAAIDGPQGVALDASGMADILLLSYFSNV